MRILFFSNYYPPYARGGYEQWCQEVTEELVRRGHTAEVVTSSPPQARPRVDQGDLVVHRCLELEADMGYWQTALRFVRRQRLNQENLARLRRIMAVSRPDVAFIWGMWNVPRSVPALVEQLLPGRVAYYLCDYWPALPSAYEQYWRTPSGRAFTRLPKRLVGQWALRQISNENPARLRLEHVMCVSRGVLDRLRAANVPLGDVSIVYGGTQVEDLAAYPIASEEPDRLKLLFSGRVTREKGADVALRALSLVPEPHRHRITLDFMGVVSPAFRQELSTFACLHNLEQQVSFLGGIPRSEVPAVLAKHDVLVFPSVWDAFPRAVLEAMAAGLVVVGTTAGGTGEVLIEDETGLTFPVGDAESLARQLHRLLVVPGLRKRLAEAGRHRVVSQFTLSRMVDEIESRLIAISTQARA